MTPLNAIIEDGKPKAFQELSTAGYRVDPMSSHWYWLEQLTPTMNAVADNDANWVTVQNIAGRGILISVHFTMRTNHDLFLRVTLDGTVFLNSQIGWNMEFMAAGIPLFAGFEQTCLVEMRLNAVGTCYYGAYSVVE